MVCLHDDCAKPCQKKNSAINLAIVNYTINRRNRRASGNPQDTQRDGQTRSTTFSLSVTFVFHLFVTHARTDSRRSQCSHWDLPKALL